MKQKLILQALSALRNKLETNITKARMHISGFEFKNDREIGLEKETILELIKEHIDAGQEQIKMMFDLLLEMALVINSAILQ